MSNKFELLVECEKCDATGIYTGIGEGEGCGVPCRNCDSKGYTVVEGKEFIERKKRDNVKKVFYNTGIAVGYYSRGGVSYDEWLEDPSSLNKVGNELRDYECPFMVYQGCSSEIPLDLWSKCDKLLTPGQQIQDCSQFSKKYHCWEEFDKEILEKDIGDNLWESAKTQGE